MKLLCKRNIENDFGVILFAKGKEYPVEFSTGEWTGEFHFQSHKGNRYVGGIIILAWAPPIYSKTKFDSQGRRESLSCNMVFNIENNYSNGFMNLQQFFKISPELLRFLKSNSIPSRDSTTERFDL